MKEVFLHYIWRMRYFNQNDLKTSHNSYIEIINPGTLNLNAGPDFLNAEIVVRNQLWAGSVEMHVNSSDWDLHKHSSDLAYQNVILHVVWNHDKEIDYLRFRNVETLILKDFVPKEVVFNYENILRQNNEEIPCRNLIKEVAIDWDKINFWLDGLLVNRLELKMQVVLNLYESCNHNWEEVTFKLIAQNFGLKINQEAFEIWANSFPFKVLQKIQHNPNQIEALFFGQAGFLEDVTDEYSLNLLTEYQFLQRKYNLAPLSKSIFKFSSLRPLGFPTIRLAQLASLYTNHQTIFSLLINFKSIKAIEDSFSLINPSDYWETHYVLGKESKKIQKSISISKIHNLIINTILPLRFTYEKLQDKVEVDFYIQLLENLKVENNSVVDYYKQIGFKIASAKTSQALLQLKKYYCDEKKCLNCAIGTEVLKP